MDKLPDLHLSRVYAITIVVLGVLALFVWLVAQGPIVQ
jgi:hypothetical protein